MTSILATVGFVLIGARLWLWLMMTWLVPARKAEPVVERVEEAFNR